VVAHRKDDGTVHVLMGQRRTRAAVEAERPLIPVMATESPEEAERIITQVVENIQRSRRRRNTVRSAANRDDGEPATENDANAYVIQRDWQGNHSAKPVITGRKELNSAPRHERYDGGRQAQSGPMTEEQKAERSGDDGFFCSGSIVGQRRMEPCLTP
jgi:hypothetical protein